MASARTFPTMPDIEPITNKRWRLQCDYAGPDIGGKITTIKAGLETDGGSIPRLVWPAIGHPFQIPELAAFVLHDAEYMAELYTRAECDWRMLCALQILKVRWTKRNTIYLAVRFGGGVVWASHRIADIFKARELVGYFKMPKKSG